MNVYSHKYIYSSVIIYMYTPMHTYTCTYTELFHVCMVYLSICIYILAYMHTNIYTYSTNPNSQGLVAFTTEVLRDEKECLSESSTGLYSTT
jgi:hypothetical protein